MYLDKARTEFLRRHGIAGLVAEMAGTSVSLVNALKYHQIPVSGGKVAKVIDALDRLIQLKNETQQQNEKYNSEEDGYPAIEVLSQ